MRQTTNPPTDGDTNNKARGSRLFADHIAARLTALRFVICLALFSGIMLSSNLWFPTTRSFPRVPLIIALPQAIVPPVEYLLSSLLIVALAAIVFAKRPVKYLIAAIILLTLLVLLDQMRLQPWVYQYLLLLIIIALHNWQSLDEQSTRRSFSILQLIIAMFYFWSGVQKLNYSFSHEVLPQLLTPLQNYLPLTQMQLSLLGIGIAFIEIFTGCGLLLKRTRKLCVWLALAMHGIILVLLIGQGRNHVVWAWNAALMPTIIILFWRSDTFIRQASANWRASNTFGHAAQILATICVMLPILSFWGWWDKYLSGALYSGNTAVAVVRVDTQIYENLPETAKRQVFTTKKSGEQMLPVFEWSMAELNVPPYPEPRVFKQVTREICRLAEDKSQVELIMNGSPAILDGDYKVIRLNCSQLDE
jgi:hypothetical protein